MSFDYSRFYLVGSNLIGFRLCCVDCDENDVLPWLTDHGYLDLGEMVHMADQHVTEQHPDGQPDTPVEPVEPVMEHVASLVLTAPQKPTYSGILAYLEQEQC